MKRSSSTRLRLEPRPPILISSSARDSVVLVVTSRLRSQLLGRPQHRLHDVLVAGAAAQVAGQRPPHVFLGRVRVAVEQGLGGQHHARRAEPALEPVLLPETLLERVQLARRGQALHGGDLAAVDLHREHRAGLDRPAVDEHRAGTAVGRVAAPVRAGQPDAAADQVGEQQPRLDLRHLLLAVDRDPDPADGKLIHCLVAEVVVDRCHGQAALSAVASVPPRMRLTKTRTRWRLYSAVPRWSVLGRATAAARSAASAMPAAVSGFPVSAAAASAAPIVDPPTPVSAMPARITVSPDVSMATAVPPVAKSPPRRSSLRYPPDLTPFAAGTTASTAISSCSSAFSKGPVTKPASGMARLPFGPCAITAAPSASITEAQSPCGSAWHSDPTSVPRFRTSGSATSGAAAAIVGCVPLSRSECSRSAWRQSAPMCRLPSGSARWYASPGTLLMSTSISGEAKR